MKNFKKIGAMILVVAMMCAMSVTAFAAQISGTDTTSAIDIVSATIDRSKAGDGVLKVSVEYKIDENVTITDKQITMLGYVFDTTDAPEKANTTVHKATGDIRAIDQNTAASTGTVTFSLAIGDGTNYTVTGNESMVIKIGSDAEVTSAQAFYISLAKEKYAVTYEAGTYGESKTPEGTMTADEATEGDKFELPACEFTLPTADAELYEFAGWKIKDATEDKTYQAGDKIDVTGAITLVAQWKDKPQGMPGDVSSMGFGAPDEQVNTWDIAAIKRYCSDQNNAAYAIPKEFADVSGLAFGAPDGQINTWDIAAIKRYCSAPANPDYALPTGGSN